jgi:DNA replication protein DnaC
MARRAVSALIDDQPEETAEARSGVRRQLTLVDMERMRIPPRYREAHFEGVSAGPHKRELYNYLVKLDEMLARGVGLVLSGPNGTGKTSLAVIVLKEARRRGHTGLFVEAATLRDVKFGNRSFEDEVRLWDRLLEVDVLVLDDLGKGVRDKEGAEERLLDELLRYRGAYCRTTLITTNMSTIPRRRGDLSQWEEYLKASTIHMLSETSVTITVMGANLREGALDDVVELIFTGDK